MNNNDKNTALPALRFPEFRDTEGWEEKTLGEVSRYENGKAHEQDIAENGKFVVVNSKFISTDGEVKKFTNTPFCIAKKGDILMVLSDVPNGRAIAKCFFVQVDNLYTVNQRICKITPTKANGLFLYNILNRNPHFLAFDDGVKQTNLKNDDVLNCPLILPKNQTEQQKIASCLSSLDDLISAQSEKIEAYKTHKKGLMQQLFPAEGESVPALRFAEFVESEGWEEVLLDTLSLKISDGIHTTPVYDNNGEYYFINGNNLIEGSIIIDEKTKRVSKEEYNKHRKDLGKNTILLSINGTIGNISFYNNEKVILGKSACYINIDDTKVNKYFIANFLKTEKIEKYFNLELTGSTIKNLSLKSIKNTIIDLPSKAEQQKIASCLSSLDDLIQAESDKLEGYKAHKKGLMQQLFPNTNEAEV